MFRHLSVQIFPAESLRRAIIHLRLAFSLVLTPLFIWGVYLALPRPLSWAHILLAYLIVHVPLYGGMNAFNSYFDRDEGPIGALAEPPPVDQMVLLVAIGCKAVALVAGLWLDLRFGLLVGVGVLFSVLYSHPRWRWKERPAIAAAAIFVCQGILGVLWGWVAATWAAGETTLAVSDFWPRGWIETAGVLGAAGWTLGFYPLTGAYQIDSDARRGIRTLAVALGVTGCFLAAVLIAPLGGVGVWVVLVARGAYLTLILSALYTAGTAYYIWRWYRRFGAATARENQRTLMRLSYANGLVFTLAFLGLVISS
jgi:4-hydroxybenzoate polyprenyltransferase